MTTRFPPNWACFMLWICIFPAVMAFSSSFLSSLSAWRQAEGGGCLHPAPRCHEDARHFREWAASHLAGIGSHLPPWRGRSLQRYVLPVQLTWAADCLHGRVSDKTHLSVRWDMVNVIFCVSGTPLGSPPDQCGVRETGLGFSSKPFRLVLSNGTFCDDGRALYLRCPVQ